ncbi:hypothetical protein AB0D66_03960 [Streptomyces sp. NPDC048270]|uniref:hypothetical protein n=1 Tax=Streptomyces sp. NPDC048270 TaxID=3154615 RepID=UPI00340B3360
MFIRPVGVTVRAADRPAGRPLLRGLLARAAGAVEGSTGAAGAVDAPPRGLLGRAVGAAEDTGRVEWPPEQEPEPEHEEGPWPPDPGSPEEPPPAAPAPPAGLAPDLAALAALAREGLLTPEEFTAAKARLLRG